MFGNMKFISRVEQYVTREISWSTLPSIHALFSISKT